jgi:hypothetical protein
MKKWLVLLLMTALIFTSVLPAAAAAQVPVPLVVVYLEDSAKIDALIEEGLDIVDIDPVNNEVFVVLHEWTRQYLEEEDLPYDIITEDLTYRPEDEISPVEIFGFSQTDGRTSYRTWDEYVSEVYEMEELYPELAKVHVLGYSHENRPILAVEISTALGVEDGRPEHVHMAMHHAREWPTGELATDLAWYLLDNYGANARVTNIVDTIRVWVLPNVNPDGFWHSQNVYQMWRKNRSDNGGGYYGVDLNRNYSYNWGGTGSSSSRSSDTYHGTGPFSEPEMAAVRDFLLKRQAVTVISGHTHGRWLLYAWGYKRDTIPDPELGQIAQAMAAMNGHTWGQACTTLYATSGDTCDWYYGGLRGMAFTFEYGTSFIPPYMGTVTTTPYLVTDLFGSISGSMLTYSIAPSGESGSLVDCGMGISAEDFPAEVAGNIALIERGEITFREKALNAVDAGAVAAVIYNNTSGSINGSLSSPGVPIPVMGITRAAGRQILDALQQEKEVQGTLQAETAVTNTYAQQWELQLPAFLYGIEKTAEYSSVVSGSVVDKLTGEPVETRLEFSNTIRIPLARAYDGKYYVDETHTNFIDALGSYTWNFLPSKKPEIDSSPYLIKVSSPGRYPQEVELEIEGYQEAHELNFELQPAVKLLPPFTSLEYFNPNQTIPFKFATFNSDGEVVPMEDVRVTVFDGDMEVITYVEGEGARNIRPGDNPGEYIVNINTNHLGLGEGTYNILIEFSGIEGDQSYMTSIRLGKAIDQAA